MTDFEKFPKIARLNRDVVITEKIDGTNGQVLIEDLGDGGYLVTAGSRNRWLEGDEDNHGFAAWVYDNADKLIDVLGPGRHFGEWWGSGIQRGYGLAKGEKRFSLFNVKKWSVEGENVGGPLSPYEDLTDVPGLRVVPVIWSGLFDTLEVASVLAELDEEGSYAEPGYDNPEGVIVYHTASNHLYKATIEGDDEPKSKKGSE